jgi:hypothetical protein
LVEADTTISGHFLWAEMEGTANPANQPISAKIAKMTLFNPCMQSKKSLVQMTLFDVAKYILL